MEWYALCHIGAEEALKNELEAHNISCKKLHGACLFTAEKEAVTKYIYHTQVSTRVLLATGTRDELALDRIHNYIPEKAVFRVTCEATSQYKGEETAMEVAANIGEQIDRTVNLEDPEYTIYCLLSKSNPVGIDVAGDIGKRYYRAFTNAQSIKGTLAATLLYIKPLTGALLDPFGNTGEISIEAAMLRTNTSPLKYRKHEQTRIIEDEQKNLWIDEEIPETNPVYCFDQQLGNLRSAKKNAKLGGVDKAITFSKLDPEWMDVKFKEEEINTIITLLPPVTARNPSDELIKELCYQTSYILKKKGLLIVMCITPETAKAMELHAKNYKLLKLEEHVIYSGEKPNLVQIYGM